MHDTTDEITRETGESPGEPPVAHLEGRLAERDRWTDARCSIRAALDVVGTRSALIIMREAFYGTRRFDDFAQRVGITQAVASARLKELVAAGLLTRRPYQEPGQRTRYEYILTPMGRDLLPVAIALMQWGDTHLSAPDGPPLTLRHAGCGAGVRTRVRCDNDHDVPLSELSVVPGAATRPRAQAPGVLP